MYNIAAGATSEVDPSVRMVPLSWIKPSPFARPLAINEPALETAVEGVRADGMAIPLLVRGLSQEEGPPLYLVQGKVRYRLAHMAGLAEVPVRMLASADDPADSLWDLLARLQAGESAPIEAAWGYRALRQAGCRAGRIAELVGVSRDEVEGTMRLVDLPEDVQGMIHDGRLDPASGAALADRFRQAPEVTSALAALVADGTLTADDLAESRMPAAYRLARLGVIREVGQDTRFSTAVCQACPYGALRRVGAQRRYCLRPAHYDELQAAAIAADAARVQALGGIGDDATMRGARRQYWRLQTAPRLLTGYSRWGQMRERRRQFRAAESLAGRGGAGDRTGHNPSLPGRAGGGAW